MDAQERILTSIYLKPRTGPPVLWEDEEAAVERARAAVAGTRLDEAEFVALDVETTGNTPFWVIEIGAERFDLERPLSLFDTLVECRAPINVHARRRHRIDRAMLEGAPAFGDARGAFLRFADGAALVEHSHDAFDTYLMGRGLDQPLRHPVFDTSTLSRLVLGLPMGQTPGLARVVDEMGLEVNPAHAALSDAQATAAVFRELVRRGRAELGWECLGDLLAVQERKQVDRSALEPGGRRPGGGRSRSRSRGRPAAPGGAEAPRRGAAGEQ